MEALAQSPFGRVAPELRNQIYEIAFDTTIITEWFPSDGRFALHRYKNHTITNTAIGMLGTCKAIRSETLQLFFSTARIEYHCHFRNPKTVRDFVEQLPFAAMSSIQALSVDTGEFYGNLFRVRTALRAVWRPEIGIKVLLPQLTSFSIKTFQVWFDESRDEQKLQLEVDACDIEGSTDKCIAMVDALVEKAADPGDRFAYEVRCSALSETGIALAILRAEAISGTCEDGSWTRHWLDDDSSESDRDIGCDDRDDDGNDW
ncbi:hypothetical protein EJ03DRAFT_166345 [Teratosphaeria nubilosa]|uniref:Uncharacterized protein n=1 Tax=Teratosphaeria nubilosa TaxID=161662 RepID=A0A6G1L1W7_9PEZI|nr:hypothetical protein EJ03DRAFT_166345 [Teratosphaeria nubilosa]